MFSENPSRVLSKIYPENFFGNSSRYPFGTRTGRDVEPSRQGFYFRHFFSVTQPIDSLSTIPPSVALRLPVSAIIHLAINLACSSESWFYLTILSGTSVKVRNRLCWKSSLVPAICKPQEDYII